MSGERSAEGLSGAFPVAGAEAGLRLDRFVALRRPGLSRGGARDLVERGLVTVDGAVRPPDHRLRAGETVTVAEPGCAWEAMPLEDWILHEDDDILVINKPSGLLMHPVSASWLARPEAALAEPRANLAGLLHLRCSRLSPPVEFPERSGLIHRLDRDTSGVLVAAKTRRAQEGLTAAFAERRVEKRYRAVVLGRLSKKVDVSAPLGPARRGIVSVTPYGREARTAFSVVKTGRKATLVEARPLTGRTHQIRAHLSYLGHPVIGDPECGDWGSRLEALRLPAPPRMMLHAYHLAFEHPVTGEACRFTAPIPKDFRAYWKSL